MFDIGFAEMLIIALLGLVVLGPERLPQTIRTVVRWIHYLKQTASNVRETVENELNIEEIKQDLHFKDIERQLESVKQQASEAGDSLNTMSSRLQGEVSELNQPLGPQSDNKSNNKKAETESPPTE
ncbi:Sec-independent protein translocase protein TatB [Endozoicomonas montiporae]|uniref:Sec-independent protein translocase protein TatB n=1 Tax=Endozoicomonas montiporae CL-33 TaxID=570277 RepID=A0A142BHX5_9GAMM|nr:Sec-independent protein translocase protein TatB [Endozoicomonas montiporae]AMO58351.1 Tat/twin arginine translocation protein TatB [Endozoicomonas montiporae CL-33]